MKTATVRHVQHNLAKVLEWVEHGEEVTVTRHNRIVATIVPAKTSGKKAKMPDFAARLKKLFPNGPIKGDPQEFWDEIRGERF